MLQAKIPTTVISTNEVRRNPLPTIVSENSEEISHCVRNDGAKIVRISRRGVYPERLVVSVVEPSRRALRDDIIRELTRANGIIML